MRAYVIKCSEGGYHHEHGINKWPIMDIYRTQKEAVENGCIGDEIVPVEIKEIAGIKRRKVK